MTFARQFVASMLAWVEKIGRDITNTYIAHGHGGHRFRALALLERFPRHALRPSHLISVRAHHGSNVMTQQAKGNLEIEEREPVLIVRIDGGPHQLFSRELAQRLYELVNRLDDDPPTHRSAARP